MVPFQVQFSAPPQLPPSYLFLSQTLAIEICMLCDNLSLFQFRTCMRRTSAHSLMARGRMPLLTRWCETASANHHIGIIRVPAAWVPTTPTESLNQPCATRSLTIPGICSRSERTFPITVLLARHNHSISSVAIGRRFRLRFEYAFRNCCGPAAEVVGGIAAPY